MTQRGWTTRCTAVATVLSLCLMGFPALAAAPGASLRGHVFSGSADAPLPGARVHLGDPESGQLFRSEPAGERGGFEVMDVPAGEYRIAVEAHGGLYLVETPIALAPGQKRTIHLAVRPAQQTEPDTGAAKPSLWNNALTATLVVLGSAIVLGLLVDELDDDDTTASPSGS